MSFQTSEGRSLSRGLRMSIEDEKQVEAAAQERAHRTRVLKGAQAAFNQQHSAVPCVVRDLSESGAKIEFDLGWIVPSHFTLFVSLDGFKVECEKVWHRGNLYGVRFIGPRLPTEQTRRQSINLYDMKTSAEPEDTTCSNQQTSTVRRPQRPTFGKFR